MRLEFLLAIKILLIFNYMLTTTLLLATPAKKQNQSINQSINQSNNSCKSKLQRKYLSNDSTKILKFQAT